MSQNSVITTVKKREEYFVQFTPEEMESLGIRPGDKFELSHQKPDTLLLKKMVPVEMDLGEMDKETLVSIITMSVEQQIPADDVIRNLLTDYLAREGTSRLKEPEPQSPS